MSKRYEAMFWQRAVGALVLASGLAVSVRGAVNVTFDQIARDGDPVPGQVGSVFSTFFSKPSINAGGTVVFQGSGSASGIYFKSPTGVLSVLVDGTATAGAPTYPVPGHPGAFFTITKPPVINDRGDVVFVADFSGGRGVFATNIAGGGIVNLMDDATAVPGFPGTLFYTFGFTRDPVVAVMDNNGNVVIRGEFQPTGAPFIQQGLYATTVAGTPLRSLVDSMSNVAFTPSTLANRDPRWRVNNVNVGPALTDTGHVVFRGTAKLQGFNLFGNGIFSVPFDGTSLPTIVAMKFDEVPTSGASTAFLNGFFAGYHVNDAGVVTLQATHTTVSNGGLYAGDVTGAALALVVDNLGGFAVPGKTGVNFNAFQPPTLNQSGQIGFYSSDNDPTPNNGGLFATDLTAGQPALVANTLGVIPPGRAIPSVFNGFSQSAAPAINDTGNMVFGANGNDGVNTIFGLYFFDACTGGLERIVDDQTATTDLGATFSFPHNPAGFQLFVGADTVPGSHQSINNNNDVAFFGSFSFFDTGIYVAHVQTAGGGGLISLTCPPDLVATSATACGGDTSPAFTGTATAVDGCTGAPVATAFTDVSVSACGGTQTITRTWTAATASCVQLITTVDTVPPSLAVPIDVTIGCGDSTDPINTGQATVADACDVAPSLTYADSVLAGICGQASTITRTWTATDACGNTASIDQIITVTDTTAPVLTVPADILISCDASTSASFTGQAIATDNCDPAPTVTSADVTTAGTCPQNSVVTRTWTATDACGNTVFADQIITRTDGTAPMLTLPPAATVECDADSSSAATGVATATDNCDGAPSVTSFDTTVGGACPQASQITRTWSAADACGNSSSANQSVSVVDTTAPVITLNGAATIVLAGCVGQAYVEQGAGASDNCDLTAIAVAIGGDVVNTAVLGTYVVTYNAQDACANAANPVTRTVNVSDTTAPAFTSLPADLIVECEGGAGVPATNANIVAFLSTAAASDACDPIVGITNDAPAGFPIGDTTVTWTATDASGNAFTASRIVHVVDTVPPVVTCQAGTTIAADVNCQATVFDVTGGVVASDICADALSLTITQSPLPGTSVSLGTQTVTVTATDPNGNASQCTTTLTVTDASAPTLTVPVDIAIECDAPSDPAATGQASAGDNCDPAPSVTFSDSAAAGACPALTVLTRQWTASDAAGNASIGDQMITLQDTTAPSVACPANIATSGGFGGTVVAFAASAADACDPNPSVIAAPPSGSFFATGVTPVSATASDTCGNASAACSFDVLVSCFGVNRAKIGTKDSACRGIEEIEFTSMNGTEELVSLFKAEENSGGTQEDTLPVSIVVDDGVNGPVTIDTSCATAIFVGDVFGPYTVTDIEKDFDSDAGSHGNKVELRGSFVPATPYDLALDDFVVSIDDGQGNVAVFTIPAGSFQIDGNPSKGKYKFEGNIGVADVEAKLKECKFKFEMENATNTGQLLGTAMTIRFAVGPNVAEQTLAMEDKGNHLKFKGQPKVNCCPDCVGVASMQVTSDQGVLVFVPAAGATKLPANTVVNDGVNGAVTIHTSCSQPLAVGDQIGAYTISEVTRIFE